MAKKDKLDPKTIEREYGFAYTFFKSDAELWKLLNHAVNGGWDVTRFQAELKDTKWYKQHSDIWRQMTALQYSDPKTFQERLGNMRTQIQNLAGQWGADLSSKELDTYTHRALLLGWSPDQILDHIAKDVRPGKDEHYGGQLSGIEANLRALAQANGVAINDKMLQGWMQAIVRGDSDPKEFETYIRDIASKTFGAYGKQIKAGMNMQDLAAPYIQSMANILELNPNDIDLTDRTIRSALSQKDPKTGEPTTMSITDFEDSLRSDKRYQYTDQAKTQMKAYAIALGKSWGVLS